jgi:predicted transcriptional regulator
MEVTFHLELEATLKRIAAETGRDTDQVVVDLVTNQLEHDAWFRQEVRTGIASLDRGEFISHEEVDRRIQQMLRS